VRAHRDEPASREREFTTGTFIHGEKQTLKICNKSTLDEGLHVPALFLLLSDRILCSAQRRVGGINIVVMDRHGDDHREQILAKRAKREPDVA